MFTACKSIAQKIPVKFWQNYPDTSLLQELNQRSCITALSNTVRTSVSPPVSVKALLFTYTTLFFLVSHCYCSNKFSVTASLAPVVQLSTNILGGLLAFIRAIFAMINDKA
jgi:hypothetical protein